MCLGAFCKHPLNVTLRGVTNNSFDPSPDLLKQSAMSGMATGTCFFVDRKSFICLRGKATVAFT